jgi:hypothetical protein
MNGQGDALPLSFSANEDPASLEETLGDVLIADTM